MMKNNDKKKGNTAKKLMPAAGMLALSASMLATSTYAWFTMSREVEVKNIKMTATVPEDIQISLGHLEKIVSKTSDVTITNVNGHTGLAGNEGLLKAGGGGTADDGGVQAPSETMDEVSMLDWANSADISAYYQLGKIMPASSTTGANIYFTPDADGVGKSLKTNAKYYTAATLLTALDDNGTATGKGIVNNYRTKLHANVSADDEWGTLGTGDYTPASAWNVTNHDGYYVDIPVWLRTSSTDGANLAVDAYVTSNAANDDDDLYLAARAVVLYDSSATIGDANTAGVAGATPNTSSGLVEVKKDSWSSFESIVDFMTSTNATGEAVDSVANGVGTYDSKPHYTGAQIVQLPKSNGSGAYGAASKVIIRVWLEGEDPNCWNQNAGQDFNISLKFTKDALVQANVADGTTPDGANYPMAKNFSAEAIASGPVKVGDQISFAIPSKGNSYTIAYHVIDVDASGNPTWELLDGSYHVASDGKKHQIKLTGGTGSDVEDSASIVAWLNANVKTKANITTGVTVTEETA